jgi:DNA-binding IclR family transcriptional regulator
MGTVHRILKALEEEEFVFQDPVERKYYLGLFTSQLSLNQSNAHKWLIAKSFSELNRIWEIFNEFTALDIEVGVQTINLLTIRSKSNYSITRPPVLFFGSESIVLLAQRPDDELEVILNHINPKSMGKVDKETIKKQLKQARKQGYYVSTGKTEGIMAVSVPISHYLCPAALSVVGPEIRIKPVAAKVVAEMLKSAKIIAEKLNKSDRK